MNREKWGARIPKVKSYLDEHGDDLNEIQRGQLEWYVEMLYDYLDDDIDDIEGKRKRLWSSLVLFFRQLPDGPIGGIRSPSTAGVFIDSLEDEVINAFKLAFDLLPKNILTRHNRAYMRDDKPQRSPFITDGEEWARMQFMGRRQSLMRLHRAGVITLGTYGFEYSGLEEEE